MISKGRSILNGDHFCTRSSLNCVFAELGSQVRLEGEYLRSHIPCSQRIEPGVAGVTLCIPFIGELSGGDLFDTLSHRSHKVEVGERFRP
jgi:hypothetical protein